MAILSLSLSAIALSPAEPVELARLNAWKNAEKWAMAGAISASTAQKKWKDVKPGNKILYNGAAGKAGNPVSKAEHGDAEIEVEFMIPKGSNSGIYLMQRYEVQILDSFGKPDSQLTYGDCGGIYRRWDESREEKERGYEGTAPATNASTAPGTWQTFSIDFRAPRFDAEGKKTENARFVQVKHNGVVIHEDAEVTGATRGGVGGPEVERAPLSIQGDHGPVAFRKILVRPTEFK